MTGVRMWLACCTMLHKFTLHNNFACRSHGVEGNGATRCMPMTRTVPLCPYPVQGGPFAGGPDDVHGLLLLEVPRIQVGGYARRHTPRLLH